VSFTAGVTIGGFALVAAPAAHWSIGGKSFIVSYDGAVDEQGLGPKGLVFLWLTRHAQVGDSNQAAAMWLGVLLLAGLSLP